MNTTVPIQKSIRFFIIMLPAFLARVNPASTMAKPHCIKNTSTAPTRYHTDRSIRAPPSQTTNKARGRPPYRSARLCTGLSITPFCRGKHKERRRSPGSALAWAQSMPRRPLCQPLPSNFGTAAKPPPPWAGPFLEGSTNWILPPHGNESPLYDSCINAPIYLFFIFDLQHKKNKLSQFPLTFRGLAGILSHIVEDKEVPAIRQECLCPFLFEGTRGVACNVVHQGRYHP